jgi:arylformamidase
MACPLVIVDISVRLRPDLVHWPGQDGFVRTVHNSTEVGDRVTVSSISMGAHNGTHMDAPVHFLAGGAGIESLDLDACIGPAFVADLRSVPEAISASDLDAAGVPTGTTRLLALTRNSGWASDDAFREDFVAYDGSAAQWCVARGIRLLGIDYLSIEPFGSGAIGNPTHKTLLGAGVVVLEGLDLAGVEPGMWELVALPIAVPGGDGAPARAVLMRHQARGSVGVHG